MKFSYYSGIIFYWKYILSFKNKTKSIICLIIWLFITSRIALNYSHARHKNGVNLRTETTKVLWKYFKKCKTNLADKNSSFVYAQIVTFLLQPKYSPVVVRVFSETEICDGIVFPFFCCSFVFYNAYSQSAAFWNNIWSANILFVSCNDFEYDFLKIEMTH